jgi:hypothetical protein
MEYTNDLRNLAIRIFTAIAVACLAFMLIVGTFGGN